MLRRRDSLAALLALSALPRAGWAADPAGWPVRPLRLVVPFPPGSSPDLIARALADGLRPSLGQTVLVENKPGAGGLIGTGLAAHAAPDGYTWLLTIQGPLTTADLLSRKPGYDPRQDLTPVSLIASSPNVLLVSPSLGVATLPEFLQLLRTRREGINYGSVGLGSASHLAMEDLAARAGVALNHVPYGGFPQVLQALLGGEIQAAFMVPGMALGAWKAGKVRALGLSSSVRSTSWPELPTLAEQGLKDFSALSWQGLLAPAGTPQALVDRMAGLVSALVRSSAFRERLLAQHFNAIGSAPEGLRLQMREDRERWGQVIRRLKLKPE